MWNLLRDSEQNLEVMIGEQGRKWHVTLTITTHAPSTPLANYDFGVEIMSCFFVPSLAVICSYSVLQTHASNECVNEFDSVEYCLWCLTFSFNGFPLYPGFLCIYVLLPFFHIKSFFQESIWWSYQPRR